MEGCGLDGTLTNVRVSVTSGLAGFGRAVVRMLTHCGSVALAAGFVGFRFGAGLVFSMTSPGSLCVFVAGAGSGLRGWMVRMLAHCGSVTPGLDGFRGSGGSALADACASETADSAGGGSAVPGSERSGSVWAGLASCGPGMVRPGWIAGIVCRGFFGFRRRSRARRARSNWPTRRDSWRVIWASVGWLHRLSVA